MFLNKKFKALKSLGQHFLTDPKILQKIVECAGNISSKNVIEIGSGFFGLTRIILKANPQSLLVIEKDKRFLPHLENENFRDIKMIWKDALEIEWDKVAQLPAVLIANLPYCVATPILMQFLKKPIFDSMTVLLQKELAEKFTALAGQPGYSKYSILSRIHYRPLIKFNIEPYCFSPPPKVESSVVTFERDNTFFNQFGDLNWNSVNSIACAGFSNPRKTIGNNLRFMMKQNNNLIDLANIDLMLRPSQTKIETYFLLASSLFLKH